MMPVRLYLVRHGESEGNVTQDDEQLAHLTKEVPNNELRLTPNGVMQAEAAGVWLRDQLFGHQPSTVAIAGFVSTFVRAQETAGHLRLGLAWKPHSFIIERDWGQFELLSSQEQMRYKRNKKRSPLYGSMPNGQSLSTLLISNYLFLSMLHREHSEDKVVAVCHGERILTLRYMLERMTDKRFFELANSRSTGDKVRNCQIVEYTRENPDNGQLSSRFDWMRSLCPWDIRDKDLIWKPIERARMGDDDLIAYAEQYPRYLS